MSSYGQFCAIARSLEVLGGRWTLLVVRELLCGSRRFGDIRRGIPRISKTILSERLHTLVTAGSVVAVDGDHGPEYMLTESGRALAAILQSLATWGQTFLPRRTDDEDLDLMPLLVDMQRRVTRDNLPVRPVVVRFEIKGQRKPRFMLLRREEVSLCEQNPGYPESVCMRASLAVLAGWWRGDFSLLEARRRGLSLEGSREAVRAFPDWFDRYQFSDVAPARRKSESATMSLS
jgi:DNA-binding HxlR family transcriptional regulator